MSDVKEILEENTTHFERTCNLCGYTWLGLHCPHDGYQNECPSCNRKPIVIDYHDCTCKGVTDLDEAEARLNHHYYQKFLEIIGGDEVFNDIPIVDHTGKTTSVINGKSYTPYMVAKNQLRAELRQQAKLKLLGGE